MASTAVDEWAESNRKYHDSVVPDYESIVRPDWLPDGVFRFRETVRSLIEKVPRGARILEIGPGSGDFCRELVSLGFRNIHAVDVSPSMISQVLSETDKVCGVAGDATRLPYQNEAFDFINVKGCLHHISDIGCAISEICRCLKPEGLFRLQEPNASSFLVEPVPDPTLERPLNLVDVERILFDVGLSVDISKTFLHFSFARLLADQGLDKQTMNAVIDALNPVFDKARQGEIFLIVGHKSDVAKPFC